MVHVQFGRNSGGLGCLIFSILAIVAGYFILKGLFYLLWWAAPALFVLALIINWKAVRDTVQDLFAFVQANPVSGLVFAVLVVVGTGVLSTGMPFFDRLGYWTAQGSFALLSFYVLLRALGYNRLAQFNQAMQEENQRRAGEFIEYEELESRPKNTGLKSEADPGEPPAAQRENPGPDKSFDQFFK